jgi:hypothetical protein
MRRDLVRRMARLEAHCAQAQGNEVPLVLVLGAEPERPLGADEHLVIDWFRDAGGIFLARERITSDSTDPGRRCSPGGHLRDVLEQLHACCEWRNIAGSCPICRGTPVVEDGSR